MDYTFAKFATCSPSGPYRSRDGGNPGKSDEMREDGECKCQMGETCLGVEDRIEQGSMPCDFVVFLNVPNSQSKNVIRSCNVTRGVACACVLWMCVCGRLNLTLAE